MKLSTIKDTLTYANRKASQFYLKAQTASQFQQENRSVNDNINWQFWIAFFVIIILLCGNFYLTSRINKHYNKINTYA